MILRPSAALLVLLFLALTAADEGYIPCENGSEYIEVFLSDGTEDFYCNCTAANTDAVSFAGTFCQYESTSFCQKEPTVSGFQHFCVNGGVCTGSDRLEDGCDCPQDYHGLRCEYQIGVDNVDTTCELACFNDGNCYEGIKEYGAMLDPFRDGLTHFLNELHVDLEYCICPPGYLGVRCEYQYQVCADAELICLHGSSCDLLSNNDDGNDDGNDGGLYYYCNCQTSVMLTAGEYCEYIVSSVCGAGSGEFCTNDGACVTFGYVPHHTRCFWSLASFSRQETHSHLVCVCTLGFDTNSILYIAILPNACVRRALKDNVVSFSLQTPQSARSIVEMEEFAY
jgi:hypothetical protein